MESAVKLRVYLSGTVLAGVTQWNARPGKEVNPTINTIDCIGVTIYRPLNLPRRKL
jgi:hypothetical protein